MAELRPPTNHSTGSPIDPAPGEFRRSAPQEPSTELCKEMSVYRTLYYPHHQVPPKYARRYLMFYDSVCTIIPHAVTPDHSDELKELCDALPECFDYIKPTKKDVSLSHAEIECVSSIFKQWYDKRDSTISLVLRQPGLMIDDGYDDLGLSGWVPFHYEMFPQEVSDLLGSYNFILKDDEISDKLRNNIPSDTILAYEPAVNILLSMVADSCARRFGLDTVTERESEYLLNARTHLDLKHVGEFEFALASSIMAVSLPVELNKIAIGDYKEIRAEHAKLRYVFRRTIADINQMYRLERIEDSEYLQVRIQEITKEFSHEFESFKQSRLTRRFDRWLPFFIGGIARFEGALIPDPITKLISTSVIVLVQCIEKLRAGNKETSTRNDINRVLATIEKDILKSPKVQT